MRALQVTLCAAALLAGLAPAASAADPPARASVTKWSQPTVAAHTSAGDFGFRPGLVQERTRTWTGVRPRLRVDSFHPQYDTRKATYNSLLMLVAIRPIPAHLRKTIAGILTPDANFTSAETTTPNTVWGKNSKKLWLTDDQMVIYEPDRIVSFSFETGLETERRLKRLPAGVQKALQTDK